MELMRWDHKKEILVRVLEEIWGETMLSITTVMILLMTRSKTTKVWMERVEMMTKSNRDLWRKKKKLRTSRLMILGEKGRRISMEEIWKEMMLEKTHQKVMRRMS
jgi:hypothetical protein